MKKLILMSIMALTLVACDDKTNSQSNQVLNSNASNALTILAGSELKDVQPILEKASKEIGVPIRIEYSGTIDGVDRIKSGQPYDIAWFSQSKYFYDTDENAKKIKQSEKVMYSPVVVGMRTTSYQKSGLNEKSKVTWSTLYDLVTKKGYKYAMTDPSASNTGYSALMGVAYSTANKTEALKKEDINNAKMENFFKGHVVNSGSSGWLVQAFKDSNADFMVNYESILLQYNKDNPNDQLTIIYPFEGIVTADYPVLLINMNKSEDYKKLMGYLKKPETQQDIINITNRRVLDTQIMQQVSVFPKALLIEMPFNPDVELSDNLLSAYYQKYKKPAAVVFVLDVSGSMSSVETINGRNISRIDLLKEAMAALTTEGGNQSKFAHLRSREKVWLMPFGSNIKDLRKYELSDTNIHLVKQDIQQYVNKLLPQDGTYLFSSIEAAVELLEKEKTQNPNYQYSVVVLTDGLSNEGISAGTFSNDMQTKGIKGQIRVFPILFGEGSKKDLNMVADSTGGKVFDGKNKNLSDVFKEIRTYQ